MRKLKTLLALLLALVLALGLTACGGKEEPKAETEQAAETEAVADAPADPYQNAANNDPYAQQQVNDPYAQQQANDPYAQQQANDPYAQQQANDPYAQQQANDPYAQQQANDPYAQQQANDPYAQQQAAAQTEATEEPAPEESAAPEAYMPEPGADSKWTAAVTADGWIKVEQEGGQTLGLSATSGVKIIEDDGFAFKDLNQNGELDTYEDWRRSDEERAKALVELMSGAERAAILSHGGWGNPTTEPLTTDDVSYQWIHEGGRGGVTRSLGLGGGAHAKWTNALQEAAESCWYGIPAMVSIDPMNVSGLIESVALGSTMDPELAAKVGQETAKQYRAAGVTALLGPQVDIASPVMSRAGGTYGEDPQLTLDIATAYINGMQSTYDESGEDLGWGPESVYCFTKHFGGAGSTEGGRDDHSYSGRYAAFPGDNLEAHLITFFDGAFKLPGKTGSSGTMTQYAIDVNADGEPYGGEWAGVYNPYLNGLLEYAGFDGLKITDWGVFDFAGVWGAEEMEDYERIALGWERGAQLLGGYGPGAGGDQTKVAQAYETLVKNNGQEKADEIVGNAAEHFIRVLMQLEMFEQPYSDSAYADSIVLSDSAKEYGLETQRASVVMLKNDGTIAAKEEAEEKPTVYVPYVYSTGFSVSWMGGVNPGTPSWQPSMDIDTLGNYFNVVTDTLGEPSGEADADGNATYTADDITRATAEEIAACDYVLVGMTAPYSVSYNAGYASAFGYIGMYMGGALYEAEDWYPVSLQYGAYTADTARETSISGLVLPDGSHQNRSYKGQTAPNDANYGHLEALQYAAENAGDVPVIVSMQMERGMVWTEVEPLADVILVSYQSQKADVVAEIILGKTEPNGLLCFQQPASMEAVEAQVDDVPRDMECYVDAAGNTYDFAFGLNWAGAISDARTEKYSAEPINKIQNIDYAAYAAENAPAAEAGEPAEEAEEPVEAAEEPAEAAEELAEEAEEPVAEAEEPAEEAEEPAEAEEATEAE